MKKLILILPIFTVLSACVTSFDVTGKPNPVMVQTDKPTVIIDNRTILSQTTDQNSPIFVCKTKPFMETYQAEDTNRGKAILAVQKQCLAKNEEMFCKTQDIDCVVYQ